MLGVTSYVFITERLYFIIYISLFWLLFFFGGTVFNLHGRTFHLHHWTIGMIFTTYLSYPHWFFAILHGLCCGVMIDGGARWGWDDVWTITNELAPGKWDVEQRRDDYESGISISSKIVNSNFIPPKAYDSTYNSEPPFDYNTFLLAKTKTNDDEIYVFII